MANFAKLFQVDPMHQVLLVMNYDDPVKKTVLSNFTVIHGSQVGVEIEFQDEDAANRGFDEYNQKKAEIFFNEMIKLLNLNQNEA